MYPEDKNPANDRQTSTRMIIVRLQFDPAFRTGILPTLNVIGRSFA
jgi:hypothetical protein